MQAATCCNPSSSLSKQAPWRQQQHHRVIAGRRPNHRQPGVVRAAKGQAAITSNKQQQQQDRDVLDVVIDIAAPFARLVDTPLWYAGEAVVLLAMLALVDAGYSGDWSRIAVIDEALEPKLQKLAQVLWSAHVLSGAAAATVAQQQGRAAGVPFAKGFLFGLMGVFEQIEWELYVVPRQLGRTLGKRVAPAPAARRASGKTVGDRSK